jgi:hypothetical protein
MQLRGQLEAAVDHASGLENALNGARLLAKGQTVTLDEVGAASVALREIEDHLKRAEVEIGLLAREVHFGFLRAEDANLSLTEPVQDFG